MSQFFLGNIGGGVGGAIETITGNDGIPQSPFNHNFNIVTANATPQFIGSAATETIDFSVPVNLNLGSSMVPAIGGGGTSNAGYGPGVFGLLTSGTNNNSYGFLSGQSITSGQSNSLFGFGAGRFITTGMSNSYFGSGSGASTTLSQNNSGFGQNALSEFSTGIANSGGNTVFGSGCYDQLKTGTANIGLGFNAGHNYISSESNNITIGNTGTTFALISAAGESGVIRIGTATTHSQFYAAGVLNTNSGRVVKITSPGAYPYNTLSTDYVILVDTSSARSINLIAITTSMIGTTYRIKDNVGTASANNITITPASGTIDGAATLVLSSNWESVDLLATSTSTWRVL